MAEEGMVQVHERRLDDHEKRLDKVDVILEKVRNRLPIWATIIIAGLLGVIGWLARAINGA